MSTFKKSPLDLVNFDPGVLYAPKYFNLVDADSRELILRLDYSLRTIHLRVWRDDHEEWVTITQSTPGYWDIPAKEE